MVIAGRTGRERQHDLVINGYPYQVVRQNGAPIWSVETVPEVVGQGQAVQFEERAYRSLHSGFGWGQALAPNVYHWGNPIDARFPMQIICPPLVTAVAQATSNGSVTGFFERGSYLYTLSGRYVNRIDPSNDSVAAAGGYPQDLGAGFTPSKPVAFDGKTYICSTSLNKEIWSFDGTTWTQDGDSKQGSYLAKFWADTYWAMVQAHLSGSSPSLAWVAQAADPFTAANWSAVYEVGDQDSAITGLEALERTIYAAKTDGLYWMDYSGRAPRIFEAVPKHANNGKNIMIDSEGQIWYPSQAGLYVYNPATKTIANASPGYGLPNRSGIAGSYTALAQLRGWVYCSVYDGTDSYIMCGRQRQETEPGFGPYIWHGALAKIASAQVTAMHTSSLVSPPRLWFGLSTGSVSYIKLPANGDNPLNDSNSRYAAAGSIYLPADDYGIGGMRWNLQNLVFEAEGLSASTTVQIYERRDLGSWTSLQTITSSGRTVINTTGDKRFNRCELRMDIVNGSSTSTPVIRMLLGRAARRPTMYDLVTTQVYCSDKSLSRMGIQSRYSGKTLWDQLETLDEYYPVTASDYWTGSKRDQTVLVEHVSGGVAKQNEKSDEAAEMVATVVMKVQADTAISPEATAPTLGNELNTGTLTVGTWYQITATELNHFFTSCAVDDIFRATATTALDANNKVKAYTLSTLLSGSTDAGTRYGLFGAAITAPASQAGFVCCLDSASTPLYGLWAYVNRLDGKLYAYKLVNGTVTDIITATAVTYGAGKSAYLLVAPGVSGLTNAQVLAYYDGVQIGTVATVDLSSFGTLLRAFDPTGTNAVVLTLNTEIF